MEEKSKNKKGNLINKTIDKLDGKVDALVNYLKTGETGYLGKKLGKKAKQ